MRRGTKSLLVAYVVLTTIFIAGIGTLESPVFHRYMVSLLGRSIGWRITFVQSETNLLRGIIVLKGFEALDPKESIHVKGDRVLLNLSSLSLIRGKIIVTNLEVDRPLIDVSKIPPPSGPTPNFMKVLLPDVMNTLFNHFNQSIILQNLILDHIVLRDFVLLRYGGKTIALKNAVLRIAPTFLQEIELEASFDEASGLPLNPQAAGVHLTLNKGGLKLKEANLDLKKIRLSLTGEWQGTLEKGGLKTEGALQAPTVLSEPLRFDIDTKIEKGFATIKKLNAQLGPATFEGKGSFHIEKRSYELSFTAKDLALESIFQKLTSVVLGPAKGVVELQGTAKGQLPTLFVRADAKIHDLKHHVLFAHETEGTLTLNWPNLDFEAQVKPGSDGQTRAVAKGGVLFKHVPGKEKLQGILKTADVKFENASLQELLPTLKVAGRLDGDLHLEGAKDTSVQGMGHAKIAQGHWFLGPIDSLESDIRFYPGGKITFNKSQIQIPKLAAIDWPQEIVLEVAGDEVRFAGQPVDGLSFKGSYNKGTEIFRIDTLNVRRGGNDLVGSSSYSPGGKIEALLKGTFNLEGLQYLPTIFRDARGTSRLDLHCSGTTKDPFLKGRVEFLDDEIEIRGFAQGLSSLKGTLGIEGTTLLPNLSGLLGDGEFRLEGRLKLAQLKAEEFDLSFRGTNLTYSKANNYRIDFDANVNLKGRMPSPKLAGRIDIVDGLYVKKFEVRDLVLKPFEDSLAEQAPWEKALAEMQTDLTIKNSGDLRIKNNVASILILSDLQIRGTYGRPRIAGALTTTEGELHYFGEDFTLNEGRLEFIDPSRREPYLTLTAQKDIPPDINIFVAVKGFLSNLEVTLSSFPPLPREDIVSLIAFGVTQEELRLEGKDRRSLGTGILAEEISSVIERPISKKTGLDVFRLEASEAGTISRLTMGKNVTDRLTLEFVNDLDPQSAERAIQGNYYLTDNILLKGFRSWTTGTTTPQYQFNVSFRLRLE